MGGGSDGILTAYTNLPSSDQGNDFWVWTLGSWSVPIINGFGSLRLTPATVSSRTVIWRASVNNVYSNTVSTIGSSVVNSPLKGALTLVGILMAFAGGVSMLLVSKRSS